MAHVEEKFPGPKEYAIFARQKAAMAAAAKRAEANRGRYPLVRVEHPVYGSLVVHAGSNYDATRYAAKVWKAHWSEMEGASVWAIGGEGR